jgi:hypothetical protein
MILTYLFIERKKIVNINMFDTKNTVSSVVQFIYAGDFGCNFVVHLTHRGVLWTEFSAF